MLDVCQSFKYASAYILHTHLTKAAWLLGNTFFIIPKDSDNLISLGTRSHIFGPGNEIN